MESGEGGAVIFEFRKQVEQLKDDAVYEEFQKNVLHIQDLLLDLIEIEDVTTFKDDKEKLHALLKEGIEKILSENAERYSEELKEEYIKSVINEITGFGPIEPLLSDPSVTDIFVNNPRTIFVERKGKVQKSDIYFYDEEHIFRLVQRAAWRSGRHLDLGTPYIDAHLEDGSRLHAIIPPLAIDGPKVSIRKFFFSKFDIYNLVENGTLTRDMARILQLSVKSRFNMVICGGTGSGKTTLMNSLLGSIRPGERVITMEDTPELEPIHHHTVSLLSRAPNPEGKGGVSQEILMINALRMRPDRVILGELRGSEAFNLLNAMNTGQDGSMATLHASGTQEVLMRLLNMIMMARYALSVDSVKQQIAGALDMVVYVARLVDGTRRVMSISQISRSDEGDIKVDHLFGYRIDEISEERHVGDFEMHHPELSPRIISKLTAAGQLKEFLSIFNAIRH